MRTSRQNRLDSTAGRMAPPIVNDVLRSQGRPLDPDVRSQMEPRFGHDFGHVRVHTGDLAAQSAESINARAFATGSDIVFGRGQFAPGTQAGQTLLAHELAHTVQQRNSRAPSNALPISEPGGQVEREADTAATAKRPVTLTASGPMIARQPAAPEATSPQLEEALTRFFEEVKTKQPKESLPQHPLVIKECRKLTHSEEKGRRMEEFLRGPLAPGEPKPLAKAVVRHLSGPVQSGEVERLKKQTVPRAKGDDVVTKGASLFKGADPRPPLDQQQAEEARKNQNDASKERSNMTQLPQVNLAAGLRLGEEAVKNRQAEKKKEVKAAEDTNAPRDEYVVPPLPGDQAPVEGVVNKDIKIPSTVGTLTMNQTIQFKLNQPGAVVSDASALRSTLTPTGVDAFDLVIRWLARGPEFGVQLAGMASLEGQPAHRKELGENRVRSVANALLGMGLGPDRIDDVPGQAPDCTRLSFGIYNCGDMHAAKPANPKDRRVEARLFVRKKAAK
jgi:outer membrane protein OmpA-like peptidoglycan-associated protein